MHIYAFGSICRGEIDRNSDIDMIALVDSFDDRFDPSTFSIYSYRRMREIWEAGNPFAWHLATESRLLFSSDQSDFFSELGDPSKYLNVRRDCEKFAQIFHDAARAIEAGTDNVVFELSTVFLAIRNFATCLALGTSAQNDFSRFSAKRLEGAPVPISSSTFSILEKARLLSTRGKGHNLLRSETESVKAELDSIGRWMSELQKEIR